MSAGYHNCSPSAGPFGG